MDRPPRHPFRITSWTRVGALVLAAVTALLAGLVLGGGAGSTARAEAEPSTLEPSPPPIVKASVRTSGTDYDDHDDDEDDDDDDDDDDDRPPPTSVPPTTRPPVTVPPTTRPPVTVPPSTTPPTTTPVAPGPAGIVSDCSVDVTAPLATLIARLPMGATLNLRSGGCYRIDRTLFVQGKRNLTIEGNGATLKAGTLGDQQRRHLWITGGSGIVVRNLTILGAATTPGVYDATKSFQHGVAISGATGVRIERVTIRNVYGDFVYVGSGGGVWSRDVTVTGSTFSGAGRQGVAVVGGQGVVIDGNTLGNVGRSMFDLEPNQVTDGAVDVTISNNSTGYARNFWLANGGVGLNVRNIVVRGNRATSATGGLVWSYGPINGYRGPFVITDNVFQFWGTVTDSGSKGGFFFSRAKGVTISGNVVQFPVARRLPAVENRDSVDIVVGTNQCNGAGSSLLITRR